MHRILVIKDVSLWLALNRHFSGNRTVRLEEAPTLEMGLEVAEIGRPEVVVCSVESAKRSLAELRSYFDEPGLARLQVVCVDDSSTDDERIERAGERFRIASSDDFIEVVDGLVRSDGDAVASERVELLAHFEVGGDPGERPRRGFANILELSLESLSLEADDSLEHGNLLSLNFFLPADVARGTKREQLRIQCEVRRCLDPQKLHYEARLTNPSEAAESALRRFLGHPDDPGGASR